MYEARVKQQDNAFVDIITIDEKSFQMIGLEDSENLDLYKRYRITIHNKLQR